MSTIQYPMHKAFQRSLRSPSCRRTCLSRPVSPNVESSGAPPVQQIDDAAHSRLSAPPPSTLKRLDSIGAELDARIARVEDSIATLELGEERKICSERQTTAEEKKDEPEPPKPTLVLMPEDPVPENAFSHGPVSAEVHPLKILRESDKKEEGSSAVATNARTAQGTAEVQHPTHDPPKVDEANPPLAKKTSTSPTPSYYDRIPPFAYGIIPTVVLRARADPSLPSCDTPPSSHGSTTPTLTPTPVPALAPATTSKKAIPYELPPAIVAAAEQAADRYLNNLRHHPAAPAAAAAPAIPSHKPTKPKEVSFKQIPDIKVFEPPVPPKESSRHARRSSFSLFRKIKSKLSPPKNHLENIPVEKVTIHAGHTPRPTDASGCPLTENFSALDLDGGGKTRGSSSRLGVPGPPRGNLKSSSSAASTTAAATATATYPLRSSPKMPAPSSGLSVPLEGGRGRGRRGESGGLSARECQRSLKAPALPSEGGDSYFPEARL